MDRQWIACVSVGLAVAALSGCGNGGWSGSQQQTVDVSSGAPRMAEPMTEVPAQAGSPIADVPVPVGFNLDQEHSRNASAAGARFVDHIYKGSGDKRTVHWFFKRQMPVSRWALMRDTFSQGQIQMDFDNSRETCRVTITDGWSIWPWSHPVKVNVVVLPVGKITTAEEPPRALSMK